jgi:hypothetical protein
MNSHCISMITFKFSWTDNKANNYIKQKTKKKNLKKKRPANLNNTRSKRIFPCEFICSIVVFFWPNRKKRIRDKQRKKRKIIITNNINKKYNKERFCVCSHFKCTAIVFCPFHSFESICSILSGV